MHRRLPSLTSVRAFEAAARHASFNRAADELSVTPSAVSHQVKSLEAHLGVPLFTRRTRHVELTAAGRELSAPVGAALKAIAEACDRVRRRGLSPVLTLSVAHTFATGWLVPHLNEFQKANPSLEVRLMLNSTQLEPHFANVEVDAAIAYGAGEWHGYRCHRLMAEELIAVCSPALVGERGPLREPADIATVTLLHVLPRMGQWREWLRIARVSGVDPDRGPRFQSTPLALEAAMAAAGVAIANPRFIAPHLETGRLVVPFEVDLPSTSGYWLVYADSREDEPQIAAFREWLLEATAGERAGIDGLLEERG
jgi:LysR family glycine cleavage system transcriptional activator